MNMIFAENLKELRKKNNMSQREIAERLFVTRSTITHWENGNRLPDVSMIYKLADCLNVSVDRLLNDVAKSEERPNVIMLDDNKVILTGGLPILEEVMPNAVIKGFTKPAQAIEYAKENYISLAFLDIEMGMTSGFDVCNELLKINEHTNVVYLTAYSDYAFDAWKTGASGFILKPITPEEVKKQLAKLRYPFITGGLQND